MNKVTILVEGYAHAGVNGAYLASPTTTLIDTGEKKILVDPGTNADKLLTAMKEHTIKHDDIDMIFLSHYHPDHFLNIRLFPLTDIYDASTRWHDDEEYSYEKFLPGTDIEIMATPGHSPEHTSLLVTTDEGIICIAQDVFWWEDSLQESENVEALLNLEDPFVNDIDALKKSRQLVLERADWIIPGHGKKFKNPSKV